MPSSAAIANEFIRLARAERRDLTPLQVLKLVYLAHGWTLALDDRPLIDRREQVQAWQYGPVYPNLYHELKHYGGGPVRDDIVALDTVTDARLLDRIQQVWKRYGHLSGGRLTELTHRPETPWDQVWNAADGRRNQPIPEGLITAHFRRLYYDAVNRQQTAAN